MPLPTAETPSVGNTVVHATDEEKLASSVGNQKWTCMTVDLDSDKQDYPQPSDLSTFVNETKFSSPTEGKPQAGKDQGEKNMFNLFDVEWQIGMESRGNKVCFLVFFLSAS